MENSFDRHKHLEGTIGSGNQRGTEKGDKVPGTVGAKGGAKGVRNHKLNFSPPTSATPCLRTLRDTTSPPAFLSVLCVLPVHPRLRPRQRHESQSKERKYPLMVRMSRIGLHKARGFISYPSCSSVDISGLVRTLATVYQ